MAINLWSLDVDERNLSGNRPIHLYLDKIRMDWELNQDEVEVTPEVIDTMFNRMVCDIAEFLELWKESEFEDYEYDEERVRKFAVE